MFAVVVLSWLDLHPQHHSLTSNPELGYRSPHLTHSGFAFRVRPTLEHPRHAPRPCKHSDM